jgi:hypothetical protein
VFGGTGAVSDSHVKTVATSCVWYLHVFSQII